MTRPSFYQLYERVLAEGPFFDMLKSHWQTGWDIGKDIAGPPRPLPKWLTGLFSKPPREVDTDPLSGGADDPFGVGHEDPFDAVSDPFADPNGDPPPSPSDVSFRVPAPRKRQPPPAQTGPKMRKYYPFGAFSPFYIEKPWKPRLKGIPGRVGATKVSSDALLRKIRSKYHKH